MPQIILPCKLTQLLHLSGPTPRKYYGFTSTQGRATVWEPLTLTFYKPSPRLTERNIKASLAEDLMTGTRKCMHSSLPILKKVKDLSEGL